MTFTPYNYVVLYIYSLEMYFLNMFQWTQTFFPHKSPKKGRKKTALESSPQCQSVLLLQIWIWPLPVPFVRKHWLSVQSDDSDLSNDPGSRTKFNIKKKKKNITYSNMNSVHARTPYTSTLSLYITTYIPEHASVLAESCIYWQQGKVSLFQS